MLCCAVVWPALPVIIDTVCTCCCAGGGRSEPRDPSLADTIQRVPARCRYCKSVVSYSVHTMMTMVMRRMMMVMVMFVDEEDEDIH